MKKIITIIALQSILLTASAPDNGRNFAGKKAMNKLEEIVSTVPETAGLAGKEFGKNVVNGAVEAIGQKISDSKDYFGGFAVAALATPAAPYVIAAGVSVLAIGATAKCTSDYRESGFRRCLNTHFASNLNERGFPQRCESPERKFAWWQPEESVNIIEHYRGQRRVVKKITKGVEQPN